jgi:hypothetical protein
MKTNKCAYPDCNNTYGITLVSHMCDHRMYTGKCVLCSHICLCGDHNKNSTLFNVCPSLEFYERKNLNDLCKCIRTDKLNQFIVEGLYENRSQWYLIHMKDGNYIYTLKYSSTLSVIYTSHIIRQLYTCHTYNQFQKILDKYEQYTFRPVLDSLKVNVYTYLHQLPKDITNIIRMYL